MLKNSFMPSDRTIDAVLDSALVLGINLFYAIPFYFILSHLINFNYLLSIVNF
jgi:hypothetical protein